MNFKYIINDKIPQAAWCACIKPGNDSIAVIIGKAVPHNEHFFVSGVWDGDFKAGRFDSANFPCCTGARLLTDVNTGG